MPTPSRVNASPRTLASEMTRRSTGSSASSRAATSAWSEAGGPSVDEVEVAVGRDDVAAALGTTRSRSIRARTVSTA